MAKKTYSDGGAPEPRFFNRELSWVEFNARVLGEALDSGNPPLERLKFVAIVSSNFDEFFMVRVAGLKRQVRRGDKLRCPSGLRPSDQLREIAKRVRQIVKRQCRVLSEEIFPAIADGGMHFVRPEDYTVEQRRFLADYFEQQIFPVLTPLSVFEDKPLPITGNLRLYLGFRLARVGAGSMPTSDCAIVQLPSALPRFIPLPVDGPESAFAMLDDVVQMFGEKLFPGHEIAGSVAFRVTRDADLSIDEERDEGFVEAMAELLRDREHSPPIRLELGPGDEELSRRIIRSLQMKKQDIYHSPHYLDLKAFMRQCFLPGFEALRDPDWPPQQPRDIPEDADIFALLRERDVLLHHPYDSFEPVVRLIQRAADDPAVLAIKITLYRTSGKSPIIKALARAAEAGKQVTALVELKARFDEEQNIGWAYRLERAGVIVVYGIANLKVHSKATLIVRREDDGIRRYIHLGTGNYNDSTAKLYTDMGLMTSHDDLTYEAALFFNSITGFSAVHKLQHLVMAPVALRERFRQLVEREIERSSPGNPGLIMAKMNSLACPKVAEWLYRASQAGVRVRLNIRGICVLVPGVPGLSENIEVVSIIDRYLEHSRIFYFQNGDNEEEVYMGSADWMQRNLDKRVELVFPVYDPQVKHRAIEALERFFRDNVKSHVLESDGSYRKQSPGRGEEPFRAQEEFYREARLKARSGEQDRARELVVRRKPPRGQAD